MPDDQKLMSKEEFVSKLKKEVPEIASFNDNVILNEVFKRRPELRTKIENPLAGDEQAALAQAKAEARSKSLVDPQFWQNHPNITGIARGSLDSLPGIGAILGGVAASPETLGAGAIAGGALGAGAGRGLRDILAQIGGLEEQTSPMRKAGNITMDTGLAAITPGLTEAAMHPVSTARDALRGYLKLAPRNLRNWIHPEILEDLARDPESKQLGMGIYQNFDKTPTLEGEVMPPDFRFSPEGSFKEGQIIKNSPKQLSESKTIYQPPTQAPNVKGLLPENIQAIQDSSDFINKESKHINNLKPDVAQKLWDNIKKEFPSAAEKLMYKTESGEFIPIEEAFKKSGVDILSKETGKIKPTEFTLNLPTWRGK